MASTEELDVRGHERRPAARPRDDVVEVEVVGAPTFDTPSLVASPDLELDRRGDDPRRVWLVSLIV